MTREQLRQKRAWKRDWMAFQRAGWVPPSRPRVTIRQVREIQRLQGAGWSMTATAKRVGVSRDTVRRYQYGG